MRALIKYIHTPHKQEAYDDQGFRSWEQYAEELLWNQSIKICS